MRLYELLKSYEYIGRFETTVDNLRDMLILENEYPKMADFKRYVIDKALDEINRFTDIEVEYQAIKRGRAITGFTFTIQKAENWDGQYHATQLYLDGKLPSRAKQERDFQELKNQISLWDEE